MLVCLVLFFNSFKKLLLQVENVQPPLIHIPPTHTDTQTHYPYKRIHVRLRFLLGMTRKVGSRSGLLVFGARPASLEVCYYS